MICRGCWWDKAASDSSVCSSSAWVDGTEEEDGEGKLVASPGM